MSELPSPKRTGFISLRWKLLIGFTLLFTVVFAGAFYWFYTFATARAEERIKDDLIDTLKGAAGGVNGDELLALSKDGKPNAAGAAWLAASEADRDGTANAAQLAEAAKSQYGQAAPIGFSDDPRYQHQMDWLDTVHHIEPRAWPYLYVQGGAEKKIIYIADLWARYDPSKATPFLFQKNSKQSYKGLKDLTYRLDSQGNFSTYTDQWGRWVSAYIPVKNSSGALVGAMGIDFQADYVDQVQQAIRDKVVVAFAVTYLTLFALVFLISGAFTRPIVALTKAAALIGEGNYEQDLSFLSGGRLRDEIGILANVFAIMVGKVYQREQTLRRQVEELRIEVDEAKRQKQVSDIVDSDFFQDLQTRARDMRKRGQRSSGESET